MTSSTVDWATTSFWVVPAPTRRFARCLRILGWKEPGQPYRSLRVAKPLFPELAGLLRGIRFDGFRQAAHYDLVRSGSHLDLVVAPMVNEWKGVKSAELRLVDVRECSRQ